MRKTTRKSSTLRRPSLKAVKSFSLDRSTVAYVVETRGERSASERANELLRRAIVREQYDALEQEAGEFFATLSGEDRKAARGLQAATRRSLARD